MAFSIATIRRLGVRFLTASVILCFTAFGPPIVGQEPTGATPDASTIADENPQDSVARQGATDHERTPADIRGAPSR